MVWNVLIPAGIAAYQAIKGATSGGGGGGGGESKPKKGKAFGTQRWWNEQDAGSAFGIRNISDSNQQLANVERQGYRVGQPAQYYAGMGATLAGQASADRAAAQSAIEQQIAARNAAPRASQAMLQQGTDAAARNAMAAAQSLGGNPQAAARAAAMANQNMALQSNQQAAILGAQEQQQLQALEAQQRAQILGLAQERQGMGIQQQGQGLGLAQQANLAANQAAGQYALAQQELGYNMYQNAQDRQTQAFGALLGADLQRQSLSLQRRGQNMQLIGQGFQAAGNIAGAAAQS